MERKTARGLLGCSLSYSLPHFLLFAKIANSKGTNKRKKRLEKEFGHWDNFSGLTKMSLGQENRSERVREDWIRTRLNLNPKEFE